MGGSDHYAVGFGKPPSEHRFKKGKSGNPKGRPKKATKAPVSIMADFGAQRLQSIILEEAYRSIQLREGEKAIELPMIQAIIRSIGVAAAKGDRHAQRLMMEGVREIENRDHQLLLAHNDAMLKYKLNWTLAIQAAQAAGNPEPEPIPHPDDIIFDMVTGKIGLYGPATVEKKRALEKLLARRGDVQEEVDMLRGELAAASTPEDKDSWLEHWHHAQKTFDIINDNVAPRYRKDLQGRSKAKGASKPGSQARIRFPENTPMDPGNIAFVDGDQAESVRDMGSTRRRR
jgi:hypothetical protein